MAQKNPRVMPNCVYSSNPYHECTQNCIHKITEFNSKPPKNKKGSGIIPLNFDRKKKLGSRPELPVLDNVPASKIGAIYLADAASPISKYYDKKKLEPKSNEIVPASGKLHTLDIKPVNDKVQPKDGSENLAGPIQTNQAGDKNSSTKVVPVTCFDDIAEGLTTSAGGSKHFCYSDVLHDNEDSDDGEGSESVVSETRVPVGRYHVKESFAPILQSIFDKYGDIGESCHLESVVMRSYYIECVCFVIQELQSTSIMHLTTSKVKELLAILNDVESAQLRVTWLRTVVNEIAENIKLIDEHRSVEAAKAYSDSEMESLRNELESKMEILTQKEREVTDIKTKIEGIRERLGELEMKSSDLEKSRLSIKSKVDNLDSRSLLDELL